MFRTVSVYCDKIKIPPLMMYFLLLFIAVAFLIQLAMKEEE